MPAESCWRSIAIAQPEHRRDDRADDRFDEPDEERREEEKPDHHAGQAEHEMADKTAALEIAGE